MKKLGQFHWLGALKFAGRITTLRESMSNLPSDRYYLSPSAVEQLSTHQFAGFTPELIALSDITPYTALDDFDQTLRKAGGLLLDTGATLELIEADGRLFSQDRDAPVMFKSDIPDGELAQRLNHLSPLRRLMPMGSGLWQRARLDFVDAAKGVKCSLSMVFLTGAADRAVAVAIWHEPEQADEQVHRLRQRLSRLGTGTGPDSIGPGDEADQHDMNWVDALFPLEHPYDAKPTIRLDQDACADDAANEIVAALIPVARANEPGIIADHDSEFLHDYRIQLRKIRSILGQYKKVYKKSDIESIKDLLSNLMKMTGRLRDLDVQLLERPRYYDLLPQSLHAGLDTLFDLITQTREVEHAAVAELLSSDSYQNDIQKLSAMFTPSGALAKGRHARKPARAHADKLLLKRFRKVCKLAARIDLDASDEQLHSLRIHCKKLRYPLELSASFYPAGPLNAQIAALKKLQDTLGRYNDYAVQQQNLIKALLDIPLQDGAPDIEVAQSIGALIAILRTRQREERARIHKSIERFTSEASQASFKSLIRPETPVASAK